MVLSMDRWSGKVAIVTGASVGIGAAICEALVENGLIVVGLARRVEKIEEKAKTLSGKKGKLYAVKTDLTREEDILKAFEWTGKNLGPVHVLVNNAGYVNESLLTESKTEDWKRVFDINVFAPCIATKQAIKIMKDNNVNGHIVNINSMSGHRVPPLSKNNVYAASKYALRALSETLRKELISMKSKIKISSVSPGLVATEMTIYSKNISDERRKTFESMPTLQAQDIADGVIYILSTPEHVQVQDLLVRPVGQTY